MAYLNSEKIKIFPFGSERSTDSLGRVLNEHNLTTLIKMLTDKKDYVISYEGSIIEFVIHGYHIRADIDGINTNNLWASISLSSTDENDIYAYLNGADNPEDGTFTGVNFSTTLDDIPKNFYTLQLLKNRQLCEGSKIKFDLSSIDTSSIHYDVIWCGNASRLNDNNITIDTENL